MSLKENLNTQESAKPSPQATKEILEGSFYSAPPLEPDKGFIYYLHNESGGVVYVGQTCNLLARIGTHQTAKIFTYFSFKIHPKKQLSIIEAQEIWTLNPIYNTSMPPNPFIMSFKLYSKRNPRVKGNYVACRRSMACLGISSTSKYHSLEDWERVSNHANLGTYNEGVGI